jgi:hypothetical protein
MTNYLQEHRCRSLATVDGGLRSTNPVRDPLLTLGLRFFLHGWLSRMNPIAPKR